MFVQNIYSVVDFMAGFIWKQVLKYLVFRLFLNFIKLIKWTIKLSTSQFFIEFQFKLGIKIREELISNIIRKDSHRPISLIPLVSLYLINITIYSMSECEINILIINITLTYFSSKMVYLKYFNGCPLYINMEPLSFLCLSTKIVSCSNEGITHVNIYPFCFC